MHKTTNLKSLTFLIGVFALLIPGQINAQLVIGSPNLGFSQACASASFNSYNVTFVFSPESALSASNQFLIEMSDATGSFASPTVVFTSNQGAVSTSPATLNFSLPEDTAGENYRIRIKSTAPAATSSGSVPFAAYYKVQDSPFTINNLVSTGAFCNGGSYLLTIDNPGTGDNDSPLNYPSLTFNWFRETSATTSVFVATGNSLTVTTPGTYFVQTNYGTCTSNSFSNRVTITEVFSGQANATIVSSLGNPYCPTQGSTTLATIGGNSYQWFKDGEAISNATSQTYQTDESGVFSVTVDLGGCQASGSITLVSEGFTSELNVPEENTLEEGETLTVVASTTAANPQFKWYLNDNLISGATTNTYVASDYGDYRLVISQTAGCLVSSELFFRMRQPIEQFPDVAKIPNIISPNGDGINDTWVIPLEFTSGTNTEIIILSNRGKVVFQTNDYQNNWPQDRIEFSSVNPVFYYIIRATDKDPIKGSITILK
ncbi:gliding motility-associated C-terminal domain-containing protein [Paucihalobacter ruber]|uniref:Gliding motility-associated C-terminal domain-containing protein n=1 Tax=Paucihalobacter ruber TaxID=2567861 RepID=A0A506PM47_9FLAO|nr:gliding motility-associated C-terminal domain-containing protein [Paucihalobacter ruber]TPV33290.1 gliding motility-associated C-terminal domain-containing protein [Paucihalobacter ruber]